MKPLYDIYDITNYTDLNESVADRFSSGNYLQELKKKSRELLAEGGKIAITNILNIFYVILDKNIPLREKMAAIACLIYVVSPIDVISDFLPAGYTDDVAMIAYTINFLKRYITPDIKKKSEEKYSEWFNK